MLDLKQEFMHIRQNKIVSQYADLQENIEYFIQRCENDEFKVAVVGEFSTGKSTFINSIIGKDILTHAAVETTANITYIRNVKADDERLGKCRIQFYDGHEQWLDDMENIIEYTTTASTSNQVAAEIEFAEIFVNFVDTANKLVLVDTPGLNGTVDKRHREITVSQIKQADACIFLFPERGVSDSSIEFIKLLLEFQHYFIFVLNGIDQINQAEESVDDKIAELQSIIEHKVFEHARPDVKAHYCGISALQALVGRDHSIKRLYASSNKDLDDACRADLLKASRYDKFAAVLGKVVNDKDIQKKIYLGQCVNMLRLLEEAIERGNWLQKEYELQLAESGLAKNNQDLQIRLQQVKENREKQWQRVLTSIDGKFADNGRFIRKYIKEQLENIEVSLCEQVNAYTDYNSFATQNNNGGFVSLITGNVSSFKLKLNDFKEKLYQASYREIVASLDSFAAQVESAQEVHFNIQGVKDTAYEGIQSDKIMLDKHQRELMMVQRSITSADGKLQNLGDRLKSKQRALSDKERERCSIEQSYQSGIRALGSRPAVERRAREVTERVKRGGFLGSIADLFTGGKKVTRTVYDEDNSKQREWDRKQRELTNRITIQKRQCTAAIRELSDEISEMEYEYSSMNADKVCSMRKVENLKRDIATIQEEMKMHEMNAKRELLQQGKKDLIRSIKEYLSDSDNSVKNVIIEHLEEELAGNRKLVVSSVRKIFDVQLDQKQKLLEAGMCKNEAAIRQEYHDYMSDIQDLCDIQKKIKGEIDYEGL